MLATLALAAPAHATPPAALAWGSNTEGQLGNGTTTSVNSPVPVKELSGVTAVSGGGHHSLVLLESGKVEAFGENHNGELGNGTLTSSDVPVEVTGLSEVAAISAGSVFSMALLKDGKVMAWGDNANGELGNGTITNSAVPVEVSGLNEVTAIAAGNAFALALLKDGKVMAWGDDKEGQLGNGTTTNGELTPVEVSGLSAVKAISAGAVHALALLENGTVKSWGANEEGQLGNGTTTNSDVPVEVTALTGVSAVSCGGHHSLALVAGTVMAWGDNAKGQLGNGTTTNSSIPVTVTGLGGVTAISGGGRHSLALLNNETIEAWGDNGNGQLGIRTNTNTTTPVAVTSATGVKGISAGEFHSLAFGPHMPTVTAMSPGFGAPAGGTKITITGANFNEVSTVKFGSENATKFTVESETSIVAESPEGVGIANVIVTTPQGTSAASLPNRFDYGPMVTTVTPNSGPQAGGTMVTITGTNFIVPTRLKEPPFAVKFGAKSAKSFKVESETTIVAESPAGAGVVEVTVSDGGGTSGVSAGDLFSYTGSPPEFGRCEKSGAGKYEGSGCVTPAVGGNYEWYPGAGEKKTFVTKGKASTLATVGGKKLACKGEKSEGEITGPKTVAGVTLEFTSCTLGETRCGSVSSEPLEGMLEWENKTDQTVDLDLFSVGRVGPVAKFTCEGVGVEVKGSVLANIKEDKAVTLYKPKLSGKRGKQKPTEYETSEGAKVPDFLEMSVAEAAFEQSGLTVKGFTLTSKEAIEINTIV